ncbi:hypothetical protein GCM10010918_09010 [Paenibacillus radicis (ex Gao et al. 2016)]|uniref:Uncharacterized protein n=1 Tax=Paenibacillus radicis (ex Gao et al. 2016) TaxID=1737354 RepID=A0A917GVC3_9BACL|nr:hypothetical protein GCM10010918_09010 [Paenibacillus radicis (ex Gao et al. 2016)]
MCVQRWVVYLGLQALLAHKDLKVHKARKARKVHKVYVLHVRRDHRVLQVLPVKLAHKDLKVHKARKDLKVLLQSLHLPFCAALWIKLLQQHQLQAGKAGRLPLIIL